ncbi:undecaprenyldiphospho-muramoylpentapeptide beta-N-acetylglucosaminyltransferase [Microvirga sp. W0021]|uniref:UDP-N-acetylglucosamine--N-acetylmuramyl-(pentapeptide) pyrophosphoryl-undecaprenol N-acetylglucosamine transferase n=1 Tax=Hohaiivirga grylli TaxID=3133970 RepID=A0ABV0BKM6_9HYPH
MKQPLIVLSAGGTGGHLFPAESLASALKPHGVRIILMTDGRVGNISGSFPADEIVQVTSASPSGGSVIKKGLAAVKLLLGTLRAMPTLRRLKPDAVVGFGGYPTVPPLLAASLLGIPTVVHEQNGVMGRANRLLAGRASLIATGFPEAKNIPAKAKAEMIYTGNPVRPAVLEASTIPFKPLGANDKLHLLVFGGSQGARVMSDIVPLALRLLPDNLRQRLHVTQQARAEDYERVKQVYDEIGVEAEIAPFFKDLPKRMADAQFIVARSGASTVAELAVLGRPSLLVPLPGAIDQDQAANAKYLEDVGAARVILQNDFTPARLCAELTECFEKPERLSQAATAAASVGIKDAGDRLAAEILRHLSDKD